MTTTDVADLDLTPSTISSTEDVESETGFTPDSSIIEALTALSNASIKAAKKSKKALPLNKEDSKAKEDTEDQDDSAETGSDRGLWAVGDKNVPFKNWRKNDPSQTMNLRWIMAWEEIFKQAEKAPIGVRNELKNLCSNARGLWDGNDDTHTCLLHVKDLNRIGPIRNMCGRGTKVKCIESDDQHAVRPTNYSSIAAIRKWIYNSLEGGDGTLVIVAHGGYMTASKTTGISFPFRFKHSDGNYYEADFISGTDFYNYVLKTNNGLHRANYDICSRLRRIVFCCCLLGFKYKGGSSFIRDLESAMEADAGFGTNDVMLYGSKYIMSYMGDRLGFKKTLKGNLEQEFKYETTKNKQHEDQAKFKTAIVNTDYFRRRRAHR